MNDQQDWNSKGWYRFVKVLFVTSYIFVLPVSLGVTWWQASEENSYTYRCEGSEKILYEGYRRVAPSTVFDECAGLRVLRREIPTYSVPLRVLFVLLAFVGVNAGFWLVARLSKYIVARERIFEHWI